MNTHYINGLLRRYRPYRIDDMHVELCKAHLSHWPSYTRFLETDDLEVVINTAFDQPLIRLGADVLATDEVVEAINKVASVRSKAVKIVDAFYYPVFPGDVSYEHDSAFDITRSLSSKNVRAFADKYRCPVPNTELSVLSFQSIDDMVPAICDGIEIEIVDLDVGINGEVCLVSPTAIEKHGIVWSSGYWCSDSAWDVIKKWLHPYVFYWTRRVIHPRGGRPAA